MTDTVSFYNVAAQVLAPFIDNFVRRSFYRITQDGKDTGVIASSSGSYSVVYNPHTRASGVLYARPVDDLLGDDPEKLKFLYAVDFSLVRGLDGVSAFPQTGQAQLGGGFTEEVIRTSFRRMAIDQLREGGLSWISERKLGNAVIGYELVRVNEKTGRAKIRITTPYKKTFEPVGTPKARTLFRRMADALTVPNLSIRADFKIDPNNPSDFQEQFKAAVMADFDVRLNAALKGGHPLLAKSMLDPRVHLKLILTQFRLAKESVLEVWTEAKILGKKSKAQMAMKLGIGAIGLVWNVFRNGLDMVVGIAAKSFIPGVRKQIYSPTWPLEHLDVVHVSSVARGEGGLARFFRPVNPAGLDGFSVVKTSDTILSSGAGDLPRLDINDPRVAGLYFLSHVLNPFLYIDKRIRDDGAPIVQLNDFVGSTLNILHRSIANGLESLIVSKTVDDAKLYVYFSGREFDDKDRFLHHAGQLVDTQGKPRVLVFDLTKTYDGSFTTMSYENFKAKMAADGVVLSETPSEKKGVYLPPAGVPETLKPKESAPVAGAASSPVPTPAAV